MGSDTIGNLASDDAVLGAADAVRKTAEMEKILLPGELMRFC